jgi:hypothetical protein
MLREQPLQTRSNVERMGDFTAMRAGAQTTYDDSDRDS